MDRALMLHTMALLGLRIRYWIIILVVIIVILAIAFYTRRSSP
ncbi:MAG: hypothetical protein ACRDFS_05845 [Chloroflexota bacterium]